MASTFGLALLLAVATVALHTNPKSVALRAGTTPTPSPMAAPISASGMFSCSDQFGGHGGKEVGSPRLKSIAVQKQPEFDRLIFTFGSAPGAAPGVPSYQLTQRTEPRFIRNESQQTATLAGTAGLDLSFGSLAAPSGGISVQAAPASLLHQTGVFDYAANLARVREIALLGYFQEPNSTLDSPSHWGIGLSTRSCFRVTELTNPVRLVIDIDSVGIAPTPGPFTLRGISDLSFVDPSHGWMLGIVCAPDIQECRRTIARTTDGGSTWASGALPDAALVDDDGATWKLRFSTPQDGWLFGPQLYTTHDAGQTWKPNSALSSVVAVASAGRSVWALTGCTSGCASALYRSADSGDSWAQTGVRALPSAAFMTISRIDVAHGWIVAWDGGATSTLLTTSNGGDAWRASSVPCSGAPGEGAEGIGASSWVDLWMVCASEPGAGQQLKTLLRSSDGGQHWRSTDLPSSGYFADIAVTSPTRAWLAFGRGSLLGTADSARTWQVAVENWDIGFSLVRFVDPLHGWASTGQQLYRTTDGSHWSLLLNLAQN